MLFVTDNDGLDHRFSIGGQRSTQGYIYPSHRVKLENFLYDLLFYFIWTTSLKFTLITFLRLPMKLRKISDRPRASVRFENGPHAKSS